MSFGDNQLIAEKYEDMQCITSNLMVEYKKCGLEIHKILLTDYFMILKLFVLLYCTVHI